MTPPDANIEKQRRRHWPVIWGIAGAFMLAILAWIGLSWWAIDETDPAISSETTAPLTLDAEDTSATD